MSPFFFFLKYLSLSGELVCSAVVKTLYNADKSCMASVQLSWLTGTLPKASNCEPSNDQIGLFSLNFKDKLILYLKNKQTNQ